MKNSDYEYNNNKTPVKWKKHLVLVEWGLRSIDNLLESIHRYPISDYQLCFEQINKELTSSRNCFELTFIIKLVYRYRYYKLPNIIISSKNDLVQAFQRMNEYDISAFSEIWYCKNKINENAVFGRMLLSNNPLFPIFVPIRYELVWGSSARIIEKFPDTNCPFVAIEKEKWNSPLNVTEISCIDSNKEKLLIMSEKIINKISLYSSEINDFATFVFSRGCSQLCIEFSFFDNKLNFIDWDSDNDKKVLFDL